MILNKEKIKHFLDKNKWIIATLVFFIAWKFFLIAILWDNRIAPPEPDDSYTYVSQIAAVKNCPHILCEYPAISFANSGGFIYFSYRIFLGLLAKLFFLSPLQVYHLGFYIGTALISMTLLFFLKKITNEKKAIAFLLFLFSFYYGTGETHGFFWVVPSFYSTLLFFLILTIILSPKKNFMLLFFLTPIFIFTHPLSIYFSFILPIFYTFILAFERKNDFLLLKKTAFVFFLALICHASISFYLREGDNYFSIVSQVEQFKQIQKKNFSEKNKITVPEQNASIVISQQESKIISAPNKELPPKESFLSKKMATLSATYFEWFFPSWIGFFPFIFFLIILFYYRQHKVLSLYFSSLIFFLISTFASEYGYRSGIILWIASFLLYGFGFFYSFRFIKNNIRKKYLLIATQIIFSLGLFVFIFLNAFYSIICAKNLNIRDNYDIKSDFLDYVITNTRENDPINMTPLLLSCSKASILFNRNQLTTDAAISKYIVALEFKNNEEKINNSKINIFFKKIMVFFGIQKRNRLYGENNVPENFHEEIRFGSVIIYKNDLWNKK